MIILFKTYLKCIFKKKRFNSGYPTFSHDDEDARGHATLPGRTESGVHDVADRHVLHTTRRFRPNIIVFGGES